MEKEARYFSIKQFNKIAFSAAHVIVKYRKSLKLIDPYFRSQIMLAVSSVNSCRICSHLHTKIFLKSGATNEELEAVLEGNYDEKTAIALLFAQHYADEIGNYDKETFVKVIEYYGKAKAYGIMAAIKIIMFGNTNGIALTNLVNRLRFKRAKNSKFLTEVYNGLIAYILLPIFIFVNLFRKKECY